MSLGLSYLNHNDCLDVTSIGAMMLLNHSDDVGAIGTGPADVMDEVSKTIGLPDGANAAESAGSIHGYADTQMVTLPV
jgi:hypothetical protein